MNNTTLAVALPEGAPKLTHAQVIRATARAMDEKNLAEWKSFKARKDAALAKLNKKAEAVARKRMRNSKVHVREGWHQEKYTVEFSVVILAADLAPEIEAYNAVPEVKRVTEEEYAKQLRAVAAGRNDAAVSQLLADPKIRKRFLELGEKLTTATTSAKPAIPV